MNLGGGVSLNITDQPDDAHTAVQGPLLPADDHRTGNLRCPHCGSTGQRRSSREITLTFREIFYQCPFAPCGHTWKASLNYDYGLSPSGIPDPTVDLPLRPMERMAGLNNRLTAPPPDPRQARLFE